MKSLLNKYKNFLSELLVSEIHMQVKLNSLSSLPEISPYYVKKLDNKSEFDVQEWMNMLNEAYDDSEINFSQAKKLLVNHHFLEKTETFFVMDDQIPMATVSIGEYPNKQNYGGVYRLAVKKKYQNKGLGKYIILLGYHLLKKRGLVIGESVINIKRKKSVFVHLSCGLLPEYNPENIAHVNSYGSI
jgi:GNAT superfamily N-acetyltransferase